MKFEYFTQKALQLRHEVYDMCCQSGTGHVTSSFSCVEIMTILYYRVMQYQYDKPQWEDRDYFILSKGQASPILYATLADCGFYSKDWLTTFCKPGGKFGVHLQYNVPGVEFTTGSLGQGLSYAGGIAYGLKKDRKRNMVYVLLGDGECYEGQIWEAADYIAANRLNNVTAIVDRNGICATDFTDNFIPLDNLAAKFEAFGWRVSICEDGHDFNELSVKFRYLRSRHHSQPACIICNTVKGKGIESICDDPTWHACCPTGTDIDAFRSELI